MLSCWQAEQNTVQRIELLVRSAVLRSALAKPKTDPAQDADRENRAHKANGAEPRALAAPVSAAHEALGGSPLDPRLTFETFLVGRSNTLTHAAAKQVAVRGAATW